MALWIRFTTQHSLRLRANMINTEPYIISFIVFKFTIYNLYIYHILAELVYIFHVIVCVYHCIKSVAVCAVDGGVHCALLCMSVQLKINCVFVFASSLVNCNNNNELFIKQRFLDDINTHIDHFILRLSSKYWNLLFILFRLFHIPTFYPSEHRRPCTKMVSAHFFFSNVRSFVEWVVLLRQTWITSVPFQPMWNQFLFRVCRSRSRSRRRRRSVILYRLWAFGVKYAHIYTQHKLGSPLLLVLLDSVYVAGWLPACAMCWL